MTTALSTLPRTGTWAIDASHTEVGFAARHLMVSKVRGRFTEVSGNVTVAEDVTQSTVDVSIVAASITTGDAQRDGHLVSPEFLDVDNHPAITFMSTGAVHVDGDHWKVPGELSIRGVTRPVELDVTFLGVVTDPWGNEKAGFTAQTEIDREAFGITWNAALETGGVLVGRTVKIELDVQLARG